VDKSEHIVRNVSQSQSSDISVDLQIFLIIIVPYNIQPGFNLHLKSRVYIRVHAPRDNLSTLYILVYRQA
jgi:hypothetical protein